MWTIAVSLIIFWVLGLVTGYTMGYFIHIPLFFAIIAMLIQVEDDCNLLESAVKRYYRKVPIFRLHRVYHTSVGLTSTILRISIFI